MRVSVTPSSAEPGDTVIYNIRYRCASLVEHCENTVIDHTLPTGMDIKSFSAAGGQISNASYFGQTMTWTLASPGSPAGQLDAGSTGMLRIAGRWQDCGTAVSDGAYDATTNLNADGSTTATVLTSVTLNTAISATCPADPPLTVDLIKYSSSGAVATVTGHSTFRITVPDTSAAHTLTDVIPAGGLVTQIHKRGANSFDFQCGGGATWYSSAEGNIIDEIDANGLQAGCAMWERPSGEFLYNITAVRWNVSATFTGSDPEVRVHYPAFNPFTEAELPGFTPLSAGDVYTNCIQSSDTSIGDSGESCTSITILPEEPRHRLSKEILAAPDLSVGLDPVPWAASGIRDFALDADAVPPITIGPSDILYGSEIGANSSGADLVNPIVTDLLPAELEYVLFEEGGTNFWKINAYYTTGLYTADPANQTTCMNPTFTAEEDWNGTGRTLLTWDFAGCTIYSSGLGVMRVNLYFSTRIKAGTTAATLIGNTLVYGSQDDPDQTDTANYTVPEITSLQSQKWVQGALDSDFSRYPLYGDTNTSGAGQYQFLIENTGNVEVTTIDVVDILPEVGDEDVLAVLGARASEWNLELTNAITVERWNSSTSSWDTVPGSDFPLGPYYSTATNPCRFENDPPSGDDLTADASAAQATINTVACDAPSWGSTAAGARSLAFRFTPASSFMPNEQLRVTVDVQLNGALPMDGGSVDSGAIAWNSFAFGGSYLSSGVPTNLLDSEPIKVGLRMIDTANLTSLGNYVWHDADADGQQDSGESPLANITVSLYNDDGLGNPVDADGNATNGTTPRATTLTNASGFYRFDGLETGADFIVRIDNSADFNTTLASFGLTTANQGDDTTDSDASLDSDGYPSIAATTGAVTGVDDPADPSEYPTFDFGFVEVASLGDFVWYDIDEQGDQNENLPVQGAEVTLWSPGPDTEIGGGDDVQITAGADGVLGTSDDGVTPITTGIDGKYLFTNLPVSSYYVIFDTANITGTDPLSATQIVNSADWTFTVASATGDTSNDSDANPAGATSLVTLNAGDSYLHLDAGLKPVPTPATPVSIGNFVWEDTTANNQQDPSEPGVANVRVDLLDSAGLPVETTYTDATGYYQFDNLEDGDTYELIFTPPSGYTLVTPNSGSDDTDDSDADATTGSTGAFTVSPSAAATAGDPDATATLDPRWDAGLVGTLSLGNLVWWDSNSNGTYEAWESGLAGLEVRLLDSLGASTGITTTTDSNGKYLFTNLTPNQYIVEVENPSGMISTVDIASSANPDNGTDSDENGIDTTTTPGFTRSALITLEFGGGSLGESDHGVSINGVSDTTANRNADYTLDFAFMSLVEIGNRVWTESDGNGVADNGGDNTQPVVGRLVTATAADSTTYTATTDANGLYTITVPSNATYTVTVAPPTGYIPSTRIVTGTDSDPNSNDNDNHNSAGAAVAVALDNNYTIDFGFTSPPLVCEMPEFYIDFASPDWNNGAGWDADCAGGLVNPQTITINGVTISVAYEESNDLGGSTCGEIQDDYQTSHAALATYADALSGYPATNLVRFAADFDDSTGDVDPGEYTTNISISFDTSVYLSDYVVGAVNTINSSSPNHRIETVELTAYDALSGGNVVVATSTNNDPLAEGLPSSMTNNGGTYKIQPTTTNNTDESGSWTFTTNPVQRIEMTVFNENSSGDIIQRPGSVAVAGFYVCEAAPITGAIGNYVWLDEDGDGDQDAGERGIPNVVVNLTNSIGVVFTTTTDSHGGYLFDTLPVGTYTVTVPAVNAALDGLNYTTANSNGGADFGNQDPVGYAVTIGGGEPLENLSADFGYNYNTASETNTPTGNAALGDRIWIDSDGDGAQDPNEVGVSGITVTLYHDPDGNGVYDTVYATTTTDENGLYIFDNLPPAAYVATVTGSDNASHDVLGAGFEQTGDPDHFGSAETGAHDEDDNTTTTPIVLAPGDVFLNADFGYQPTTAPVGTIGDTVWFDADASGTATMDAGEYGIEGVTVALIADTNGNGTWDTGEPMIATDTTDENGSYLFTGLSLDDGDGDADYIVLVNDNDNVLDGLQQTYDQDSPLDNMSATALSSGTTSDLDQDFSYTPEGHTNGQGLIGDTIWFDVNNSGTITQDVGEMGIEGVIVTLTDASGTVITTTTDENGRYYFGELDPSGTFTVTVAAINFASGGVLEGMSNTYDPDGGTVGQSVIDLSADLDSIDLDQDFSYAATTPYNLGNLIWLDQNADGDWDGTNGPDATPSTDDDEPAIAGVTVDLYRDLNGNGRVDAGEPLMASTTTTDTLTSTSGDQGNYLFTGLPNGDYVVDVTDVDGVLAGYWHSRGTDNTTDNSQADPYGLTINDADNLTADFGYYVEPAAIGNLVWFDYNYNGIQDELGKVGIDGITVTLQLTYPDGTIITLTTVTGDDPSTVTVENGWYSFGNLLLDEDYAQSSGTTNSTANQPAHVVSITLPDGYSATLMDESGAGITDLNDADAVAGVAAQTIQGAQSVEESSGTTEASYDFGVVRIELGDLPSGVYSSTLLAENGARHIVYPDDDGDNKPDVTGAIWSGSVVDVEPDGQAGGDFGGSEGDDDDGTDDDDGVELPPQSSLIAGNTVAFTITLSSRGVQSADYGLWIDWNADGSFDDENEFLSRNDISINTPAGGLFQTTFVLTTTVPNGAAAHPDWVYIRGRVLPDGPTVDANDFTGLAINGEVEDFAMRLLSPTTVELRSQQSSTIAHSRLMFIISFVFLMTLSLIAIATRSQTQKFNLLEKLSFSRGETPIV